MRNLWVFLLAATVLCAAPVTWSVVGQTREPAGKEPAEPSGEPKVYVLVSADKLERFPAQFEGAYIQVADYFGQRVDRFPVVLRRYGITPETHYGFTTQRAIGSEMLCFAARDNKEAQTVFEGPVVPEMQIYMMGRVGPRIDTGDGLHTLFYVDRIVRGHTPPPPPEAKKKPVLMKIEWQTERGTQKQEYLIPESGKRYVIPDPFDKTKNFFVTLQF